MNLGCGQTVRAMPVTSSSSLKAGDGVSDQFPVGLRVIVVDDDPTCLRILEKMLRSCLYEVTKCTRADFALSLLRENRNGYDIVISDVHMPDMDGFKLLEHVGLEMDLPVIMMSADGNQNVVMKGVTHGACDYLIKPVRLEALKNIWQHVVRKKKHEWKDRDNKEIEQSGSVEDGQQKVTCNGGNGEEVDYSSSANEGNWKNTSKRRKDDEDDIEDRDDSSSLKKPRVVWSVELHQQFVIAVNQLGIDKAVPKRILELMNVPGLTRENVASHLQKYRLYLRRLSGVAQHQSVLSNPFMGPPDAATFGLDLQALAATGQIPPQSLATLQAAALSGTLKSGLLDQRNLFSFELPKSRYGGVGGDQLNNNNNNNSNKDMNLLHGIPTNMEAKQLANMAFSQVTQMTQMSIPKGVVGNTSMVDFSGMSSFPSKAIIQQEVNSDMKGSRNFIPSSYEVFNEIHQHKPQDWILRNVRPTFDVSGTIDIPQSVMIRGQNTNTNPVFSNGEGSSNISSQQINPFDNSFQVKPETQNTLFQQTFGQEDLMSALLKQQQEGSIVPVENEYSFDGYSLDNLPV